jgi:hypothetical protein
VHTATPVAALTSEAPPAPAPPALELVPAHGWTGAEIEEAAALVESTDAGPAKWRLGDWLAARVPVGERHRKTGTGRTLAALTQLVGVSHSYLRQLRDTAHHWPAETRVPAAPFHVHSAFRDGGRERARWRRDQLLTMERYAGKITAKSLRRWREAHAEHVPSRGARQAPIRQTELAEEIDALVGKVDRAIRAGAPPALWGPIHDHLDALAADVEQILARAA